MTSFNDESMTRKLSELQCTQPAIETMSGWVRHHHKHSQRIVEIWLREFIKERRPSRLLTLLYLANDVIQTSKKKHTVYCDGYMKNRTLWKAIEHLARNIEPDDQKTAFSVKRVLIVWKDREIYPVDAIHSLMACLTSNLRWSLDQVRQFTKDMCATPPHPGSNGHSHIRKRKSGSSTGRSPISPKTPASASSTPGQSLERIKVEDNNAPQTSAGPPAPTTTELLAALKQLAEPASADAATREKIASFPEDVANTTHLKTISNEVQASNLYAIVKKAQPFVTDYCHRLGKEMEHRKITQEMLVTYLESQKIKARESQTLLSKFKEKMERLSKERLEVVKHYEALPDLTKLPGLVGNGMTPLPSAESLFNKYMPIDFGEDSNSDDN